MSEMLGVISDTERLANDLSSVDLISYQLKDDVLTTNLSRYQKASKLLNEIERSLRVFSKPETLISYCEVLRKQDNIVGWLKRSTSYQVLIPEQLTCVV